VRVKYKEHKEGFGMGDVWLAPIIGIQFGLMQTRYISNPVFLESFTVFRQYIIIAGVLGLIYAGIHKLLKPQESVHSIPFFPGMIVALWVIMGILSL
jgi:prepilin signal peptidase PulO-like enzyme (type II secretory pathway)